MIVQPKVADATIEEAMLRVRGELHAMGLIAETARLEKDDRPPAPLPEPNARGVLMVERDGWTIRIQAFGPDSPTPVVQELDTRSPTVTPEVVAVRAVEALRVVMTKYTRRALGEAQPAPQPKPRERPVPPRLPDEVRRAPFENRGALQLALGASTDWDRKTGAVGAGAEAAASYHRGGFFAGLRFGMTLIPPTLREPAGRVESERALGLVELGRVLSLGRSVDGTLAVAGGLARYAIRGYPATPDYVGATNRHWSPLIALRLGGIAWLAEHLGGYLHVGAYYVSDAPFVVVANREVGSLGRPALWASLGVVLGTLEY